MIKVAVVKPDHLGDLVLSIPAIRALERHFGELTLFVSETSLALAQFLFPGNQFRVVNFPHLARRSIEALNPVRIAGELETFELVLWLRDDPEIRAVAERVRTTQDFAGGSHLVHETAIQKQLVIRYAGDYSRTSLFGSRSIRWPSAISEVGLCVSAGFPVNRWPNIHWLELALSLHRRGILLTLVGGPGERADLTFLSRSLNSCRVPHKSVVGGPDFGSFLSALRDIDVVIATDGGTGHICSLEKPVLSIFGASPWHRYAPFGRENVVVTRDLGCSPCAQFSLEWVNGCATRECLVALEPQVVAELICAHENPRAPVCGIVVQRGTSHHFNN